MAIFLECINLVIPIEVLDSYEAVGGFRGFLRDQAEWIGRGVWYDEYLCRADGAMNPADARAMMEGWQRRGLRGASSKEAGSSGRTSVSWTATLAYRGAA